MEETAAGRSQLKSLPQVFAGRYGLSSKEFTPAMVKAVFDNLSAAAPKNHFTVGINDDVSHTSLHVRRRIFPRNRTRSCARLFYGLGADGTVGANKNSIKIIGEETDNYAQGYFVYDSKKSGSMTVSHLRFGPQPIRSTYLITRANFVACHQPTFLDRYEMLRSLVPGGTFLLNTPLLRRRKSGPSCPRRCSRACWPRRRSSSSLTPPRWRATAAWAGASTPSCRSASSRLSGVLPKDEAIDGHQEFHQENLRQEGRGSRANESQSRGQHAGPLCMRCPWRTTS